jgi:glycosyltransferase involved in cell wall biosynthesis
MVTDVYFPRINGVSTSIATFRASLQARGHRIVLIAPAYGSDSEQDDGDILRVPSRFVPLDPEDRLMRHRHIQRLIPRLEHMGEFDLVHIHTPFMAHYAGLSLARHLQVPVIESYHTYFEEYLFHYVTFLPRKLLRWLARSLSRRQCTQVDQIIVPSRAMEQVLRRYGVAGTIEILPTGIALDRLGAGERAFFAQEQGIDPRRPTLVHVGRIAFEKNVDFLLEVLVQVRERLPEVLLIIAGEGPALEATQRRTRQLRLEDNVLFVGYLERNESLWNCYRAGDAFVFASSTETQGLVLLEAMALGVPVVSTAEMGTGDLLEDGRGALVAARDLEDFSTKVVNLLTNPALRERLALEARQKAREWSADAMAERLERLYTTLKRQGGEPAELRDQAERSAPSRPAAGGAADPATSAAGPRES